MLGIIYLIGCIIALCLLVKEYEDTPEKSRCDRNDTIIIGVLGILLSWITVWHLCREN